MISANDYELFFQIISNYHSFYWRFCSTFALKRELNKRTMANTIKHTGIIDSIEGNHIKVRILQTSSCSSCKIANHCNAADTKTKIVDLYADGQSYKIQDEVIVSVSRDITTLAVLLCFVVPLGMMLLSIFGLKAVGLNELVAAFTSLSILIPYYFLIWCFRKRIAQKVSFRLEPQQYSSEPLNVCTERTGSPHGANWESARSEL